MINYTEPPYNESVYSFVTSNVSNGVLILREFANFLSTLQICQFYGSYFRLRQTSSFAILYGNESHRDFRGFAKTFSLEEKIPERSSTGIFAQRVEG